jgi:hypothetical protein
MPSFTEKLREIAADANSKRASNSYSPAFVLFVQERATNLAKAGFYEFTLALSSLPWTEEQMQASFHALKEDGFKMTISNIVDHGNSLQASMGLYPSRPRELTVSWVSSV